VYSQAVVEGEENIALAGETVCVQGNTTLTGPPCNGPGFTLPSGRSTTITFDVTVKPVGVISPTVFSVSNQGTVSGSNFASKPTDDPAVGGTTDPTVTTVVQPETITKSFNPTSPFFGQQSTLTFTITNANPATAANGITFTDVFPTTPGAMTVGAPLTTTNTCGGALQNSNGGVLAPGDPGIKLVGGSRPANTSCTISVKVTAPANGTYNNLTGNISSTEGAQGLTASASMTMSVLTAAGVSVSGRVLTAEGRGIRNAKVTITDSAGVARTTVSGINGVYRFDDVPSGQTYTVSVGSRRFTFLPVVITVTDQLAGLDFTAEPYQ
jgi:uncharacterized repeat protein (TIGR01451 family)